VVNEGDHDVGGDRGELVGFGGPRPAQQPVDVPVRSAVECFRQLHPAIAVFFC